MHYLQVLYQQSDHDELFGFLKQAFGQSGNDVAVNMIIDDSLVEFQWEGMLDPNDLAMRLTTAVPTVVVEAPSTTGIDRHSRFFNASQLW